MFGPEYTAGCPSCSAIADGFDGSVVHLANHDVTLCAVSRAPLAKLQAYKQRMGWSFPWASSFGSDFNYDFQRRVTEEQQRGGRRVQLPRDGHAAGAGGRQAKSLARRDRGGCGNGLGHVHARAAGHERVRARGRRRLPHLLGLCARAGRPLGHVPVARPRTHAGATRRASGGAATTSTPTKARARAEPARHPTPACCFPDTAGGCRSAVPRRACVRDPDLACRCEVIRGIEGCRSNEKSPTPRKALPQRAGRSCSDKGIDDRHAVDAVSNCTAQATALYDSDSICHVSSCRWSQVERDFRPIASTICHRRPRSRWSD